MKGRRGGGQKKEKDIKKKKKTTKNYKTNQILQVLHFHSTVINYAERLDEEIIQHFKHSRSQETASDAQQSPSSTHPAPRRGTWVTRGFVPRPLAAS